MADLSLVQHYLDYLRSPAVLLTILIIAGPVLLEIFKNKALASDPVRYKIPGCFRLGLTKRSNLHDQFKPEADGAASGNRQSKGPTKPRIKALFTYPIKSCRGVELAASEIVSTGFKYDRMFTFARAVSAQDDSKTSNSELLEESSGGGKHEWRFVTQRELPRLALLHTELWVPDPRGNNKKGQRNGKAAKQANDSVESDQRRVDDWAANGGCVIVHFPYEPDFNPFGLRTETITLRFPLVPTLERRKAKGYSHEAMNIWKDCPMAMNISNEAESNDLEKLKSFLKASGPLAIFRVDERHHRRVTRSLPKDRSGHDFEVGFADAFPMHLLSMASVRAVYAQQPKNDRGGLDARRFRANVYLTDTEAFDEDCWKRITVGRCIKPPTNPNGKNSRIAETDGEYHIACRTARCKLPNVHPETGIKDANEPYSTLIRTRKVDEGAYPHPCLGMQTIPLFQQGILRVGDEIEVMERGEHVYEKMFA
jgi:uncharacterized protein YcbX